MKKLLSLLFILLFPAVMRAQGKIDFDIDYAVFPVNDSVAMIEIYYNLYGDKLVHVPVGDAKFVKAALSVTLYDTTKAKLFSKGYAIEAKFDPDSNGVKSYLGRLQYSISPGKYYLYAVVRDMQPGGGLSDTAKLGLVIPKLSKNKFALSGIELASSLKSSEDTTSIFYKNTFEVLPNPSGVFGSKVPAVFYYCELYNLRDTSGAAELKMETVLLNSQNQQVIKKSKRIPRKADNIVEAGALNVSKLVSGSYTLAIVLVDSLKKTSVASTKKVYLYFPEKVDSSNTMKPDENYMASEYAVMSDEEVNELYSVSKYIAKKSDLTQWKSLHDVEAKKKFLFGFWKAREAESGMLPGEFKRKYLERVKYSNDKFSVVKRKGWLSDRGRVYITYGEPSEIERFPNQNDTKPYEIWHYNEMEGGVIFVFADFSGFNDYMLIHSTLRGELRDDSWQSRITVTQ